MTDHRPNTRCERCGEAYRHHPPPGRACPFGHGGNWKRRARAMDAVKAGRWRVVQCSEQTANAFYAEVSGRREAVLSATAAGGRP